MIGVAVVAINILGSAGGAVMPTLMGIAREKSGIIKPQCAVVIGETDPELVSIFREAGGASYFVRDTDFEVSENDLALGGRSVTIRTPPTIYTDVFVPLVAGGPTDMLARLIAQPLSARLGQQVVVDNRPGAGGNIGAEMVAKAPADGYTLFMGTSGPLSINVSLYKNLPYDLLRDFAPVTLVASTVQAIVAQQLAADPTADVSTVINSASTSGPA